jgi:hypothetical protein
MLGECSFVKGFQLVAKRTQNGPGEKAKRFTLGRPLTPQANEAIWHI